MNRSYWGIVKCSCLVGKCICFIINKIAFM
nr:MAG TPA: hypothetical protein [Caudoviricetes sp.]